jgi:bacterioferritin-associated ferredoxin
MKASLLAPFEGAVAVEESPSPSLKNRPGPVDSENVFHYHVVGMATSGVLEGEPVGFGRGMTRCECAGLRFDEIARRVCVEGQSLEAVQGETGCGHLCTACLPDLRDHLAARR